MLTVVGQLSQPGGAIAMADRSGSFTQNLLAMRVLSRICSVLSLQRPQHVFVGIGNRSTIVDSLWCIVHANSADGPPFDFHIIARDSDSLTL